MPKLKVLSGSEVIKIFFLFGFEITSQRGSHIKLSRKTNFGKQVITVPNHNELDKGTLKAIFNQALRFISESELFAHFYHS